MKFKLGAAVVAAALATTTFAFADTEDAFKLRDGVMRQNQQAMRILVGMARETADFDAPLALAALSQIGNTAAIYPSLYPGDGELVANSVSSPSILTDREGFAADAAALQNDAVAAVAAVEADGLAGLQATLNGVGQHCRSCHENWRTK